MDELIRRVNVALKGYDGDCVVGLSTLHRIHDLLREAYQMGLEEGELVKEEKEYNEV